jgi:ketosteroid isomerase-like protein
VTAAPCLKHRAVSARRVPRFQARIVGVPARGPIGPIPVRRWEAAEPTPSGVRAARDTAWAMSEENVEVVLEAFGRFEAGDMPGLAKLFDPDITSTAAEGWPEQGPWVGRSAVIAQFERIAADWSEMRFGRTEVVADADDWVVVEFSWQVWGAKSGIESRVEVASAFRVSDSLIVEAHNRWNREEALEAAGLRE